VNVFILFTLRIPIRIPIPIPKFPIPVTGDEIGDGEFTKV
jgi:hypothetical protein